MEAFIAFLPYIIQIIPAVIHAWDTAPSNSLQKVAAVVNTLPASLVQELTAAGAQLFPNLSPELHAAALVLTHVHTNSTSWVQETLNLVESTGFVNFGAPLAVDGIFGPKTRAAVLAFQAKAGLPATGVIADIELSALQAILAKV